LAGSHEDTVFARISLLVIAGHDSNYPVGIPSWSQPCPRT